MEVTCMFVGRKKELDFLNERYQSAKAELIVLYGRRRIGKTELLHQFAKDKQAVFYACNECTDDEQLARFSRRMLATGMPASQYVNTFETWETALKSMLELPGDGKKLLIIDEFPYMAQGSRAIPSILQNLWDHVLQRENVMLVLCGSSISFIDHKRRLFFPGDELDAGQANLNVFESVGAFLKNCKRVKAREDEFDFIMPNHNGCPVAKSYLDDFITAAQHIVDGTPDLVDPDDVQDYCRGFFKGHLRAQVGNSCINYLPEGFVPQRGPVSEVFKKEIAKADANGNLGFTEDFDDSLLLFAKKSTPSSSNLTLFKNAIGIQGQSAGASYLKNFSLDFSSASLSACSSGDTVEFMFALASSDGSLFKRSADTKNDIALPVLRLSDPSDIKSLDTWRFTLSAIKAQRGGVTILNNVINSRAKEKTTIVVDTEKSTALKVFVMTLDGSIVRTLEKSRVKSGRHTYTWDGTNGAGKSVARGMYFVRVIGDDIDETRKLMVVKE